MVKVNLNQMENFGYAEDETSRVTRAFELSTAAENKDTTAVRFELDPGERFATHTDCAMVRCLMKMKNSINKVEAPALAMVPHSVLTTGERKSSCGWILFQ